MNTDREMVESSAHIPVSVHAANAYLSRPRVEEMDFRDPEWLRFISAHPDALVYHHPRWLAAMEREYGQKCQALACIRDGKLEGVLPLFYTRGLPLRFARSEVGRRLSSLPRTPVAGPLTSTDEAADTLLRAALGIVQRQPGVRLEIKTTIPSLEERVPELCCVPWRDSYVRSLPADQPAVPSGSEAPFTKDCSALCNDCTSLRFGNARNTHQVTWAVKQARKHGLTTRLAANQGDLRAWYDLYLEGTKRNVVAPRPFRFFRDIWNLLEPGGNLLLLLVDDQTAAKPRLVAGSILLLFGSTAFWAFTGTRKREFCLHPNDLMIWEALHECCRRGYRWFDFGEVAEEHPELRQFKSKWGTVLQPIFRYYYPSRASGDAPRAKPVPKLVALGWQRLPLPAIALVGDLAYRFL